MKILFLTRVPMTAMRFIFPLAKRLCERGNIVEFAFGPGEGLKEVEESGFPFSILSMNTSSTSIENIRVLTQLKGLIVKGGYDVVHTYTPVMGMYGRIAAFRAQTPFVVHSVLGSLFAADVPFMHRLFYFVTELLTSRMVDLFITLTDADAHSLVKNRFASKENVHVLKYEYGVNLQKFDPDNIDKTQQEGIRKQYNLQDDVPVIGFVGRMIGAKGILDLFSAYENIRKKGVKAKLIFLGDVVPSVDDKESYILLKNLIKKSGFEDDVTFFGWREDLPLYLSLMDVVVLPSHYEGFPRIPVEAGAMKKPSICTAVSGAEVAVEDGKTGLIVPIKKPERLAEAIQKIITDSDLAGKMGNEARRRVVELFDQNKIVEQQIRIYEELFKMKRVKVIIMS